MGWQQYLRQYRSPASAPHRDKKVAARCSAASGDDAPDISAQNRLGPFLRKKQQVVQHMMEELGMEILEERLEEATRRPAQPSYRISSLVQEIAMSSNPRPILVLELGRDTPATTSTELAALASHYVSCGANAIALQTCNDDGTSNLGDLFAVVRAVRAPVLQSDWFLHPIQIVDAKQAGAAGVLGVIANVLGKGTPLLSSFTAAVGLDAPVEVVNATEMSALERVQIPFYGINLNVGLSLALPGFRSDIAGGLLGKMPFGVATMVGIQTIEEGRVARANGADVLLVKRSMLQAASKSAGRAGVRTLLDELAYACSGDY